MRQVSRKLILFFSLFVLVGMFGKNLHADQTISVTGTVPPKSSDFQLGLTSNITSSITQDGIVTYTITYGSHLYYADKLIVEAQWDQGTISGDSVPTIDGLSYVDATNAYGTTTPVIFPAQNKIRWTINTYPAQVTNQTLTVRLQANSAYTGTSAVSFPMHVHIIAPAYTSPDKTVTTSYLYDPTLVTPTPTPTQAPTTTSNTTQNKTTNPTPTNTTAAPATQTTTNKPTNTTAASQPTNTPSASNVNVVDLSQNSTQIALTVPNKSKSTVIYGLSPSTLKGSSPIAVSGTSGLLALDNLDPDTTYYMQVVTTSANGTVTKSDVFAVQTAQVSDQPEVSKTSVVITGGNDVLYSSNLSNQGASAQTTLNKIPQVPIAQNADYNLTFKLSKADKIKTVSMVLKDLSVLGISTFTPPPKDLTYTFPVVQKTPGVFNAQMSKSPSPGTYAVFIRITDTDGNITTQQVAQFHILHPLRMYDIETKKPIEDGRIVLFRLSPAKKKFEMIPAINGFKNPLYTNSLGEASEQLPNGTYSINTGRIGYKGKDHVVFTLGTSAKDDFPTIYLHKTPITPLSLVIYYRNAFVDYLAATEVYIQAIQMSNRFFDLIGLGTIFCCISLVLFLFKIKTHIAFSHIPYYVHHHTLLLFGKKESPYLHGTIIDAHTKQQLGNATIFLIDEDTSKVVKQLQTNKAGAFLTSFDNTKKYYIQVMKEGYEPSGQVGYAPNMVLSLQQGETVKKRIVDVFVETSENAFALLFAFMLIFTLLLEIVLFPAFGIGKTIPFLALSILNILLWTFYTREKGKQFSTH